MHRYLINHLSAGEFILLMMVAASSLAILIFFLVKKYLPFLISTENSKYIGIFLGSVTANYAFVLGFIIVTLWRELEHVDTLVTQEAEFLSTMVYSAFAFPVSIKQELIQGIERYIHTLINYEWPAMRTGYPSQVAESALSSLYQIIQSYSPDTKVESTFYNQFVNNLNAVAQHRGRRLEYLHTTLVDIIRYMLLFGLVLIIFLLSLLKIKRKKIQLLGIILVSCMLSFNLGLAFLFDYPLAGSIAVSSSPFTNGILKRLNHKEGSISQNNILEAPDVRSKIRENMGDN